MTVPIGVYIAWRFKKNTPGVWRTGYTSRQGSLLRIGSWFGDVTGGVLVDPKEIEWRYYDER